MLNFMKIWFVLAAFGMFVGVVALGIVSIQGCSSNLPTVCTEIPAGDSRLCDLAGETNMTLEDIGDGLIVANVAAVQSGAYSREDAIALMSLLKEIVERPVTYTAFEILTRELSDNNPELFVLSSFFLSQFDSPDTITKTDRELISRWLDKQITILETLDKE